MFTILAVEGSIEYQKIILRTLGDYHVSCSTTAEDAAMLLQENIFDLILIDINLPHKDGYSLLSDVKSSARTLNIPVLCLTGRKEITDKITAFSLGADDYITKPFDPLELRARVDARLRTAVRKKNSELTTSVGGIEIDHARHRVTVSENNKQKEIDITQTEFKILCCLARRPGQVYTRDQLLIAAWGEDARVLERVVDAHICLLRKKLGPYGPSIQAVTGVGYKFAPHKEKSRFKD